MDVSFRFNVLCKNFNVWFFVSDVVNQLHFYGEEPEALNELNIRVVYGKLAVLTFLTKFLFQISCLCKINSKFGTDVSSI